MKTSTDKSANSAFKNFFIKVGRVLGALFSKAGRFFAKIYENKKAFIGLIIVLFFIVGAWIGPLIFPYDSSYSMDLLASPSWKHPFGTDNLGRDIFRQIISGTGNMLAIAFLAGLFTVLFGTVLGILSGYLGGIADKIIQGIANIVLTVPSFPVILVLAASFTITDPFTFALILSAWSWAGLCRAVRAQVISIKERDFIQICKVMGMSKVHIIFKELMPNLASYILINFIMTVRSAIMGSVGIMMLGLAAYDPTNWGTMINQARSLGLINPQVVPMFLAPLISIIIFQIGAMLLAGGLDQIFNPRLRVQ